MPEKVLEKMMKDELKKIAQELEIHGISLMKKDQLIGAIREKQESEKAKKKPTAKKTTTVKKKAAEPKQQPKKKEEKPQPEPETAAAEEKKPLSVKVAGKSEKPEKPEKPEKTEKPEKHAKAEKPVRTERSERQQRPSPKQPDNNEEEKPLTVTPTENSTENPTENPTEMSEKQQHTERQAQGKKKRSRPADAIEVKGVLEVMNDGFGFLRSNDNFASGSGDIYVAPTQIRRFNLKTGDEIIGDCRPSQEEDKYSPLLFVKTINEDPLEIALKRRPFEKLTPIYPKEKLSLDIEGSKKIAARLIDLIAPIGKGQRGMIVAPPKAGKTTIIKEIAQSISQNYPEIKLMILLIDERPEEVTDMKRSISGNVDVIYSTFDQLPENHCKVSEIALERAQRLVEQKKDVVILLDSITRLARAYNLTVTPTGRTLSGGLDPDALFRPKKFFGAARNIEEGGSLTILATALVETGSRMDDVIFEEFKGTGNMELKLDRNLQEKRIFPAIDIVKSSTRREEDLLTPREINASYIIRREVSTGNTAERTAKLLSLFNSTDSNKTLVDILIRNNENRK